MKPILLLIWNKLQLFLLGFGEFWRIKRKLAAMNPNSCGLQLKIYPSKLEKWRQIFEFDTENASEHVSSI